MRLIPRQINSIKQVALRAFGSAGQVHLFSACVDDQRRDGDIGFYVTQIDLLLEAQLDDDLSFLCKIKQQLGGQCWISMEATCKMATYLCINF